MDDFKHLSVGIVGGGRVGAALGRALQNAGYTVAGVSGSSAESKARVKKLLPTVPVRTPHEVAAEADLLILAVPDDRLAAVIDDMAQNRVFKPGQYVLHTSGASGLSVFDAVAAPIVALAFHPAMTFTGSRYDVRRLVGATYGVTLNGRNEGQALATALVEDLDGVLVLLTESQRVLYHAALIHASNYLVTVVGQAMMMLSEAEVPDSQAILEPLLRAALGNAMFKGGQALSGPISRGDARTVQAHRQELHSSTPEILSTYDALGEATVQLALRTHRISEDQAEDLREVLAEDLSAERGGSKSTALEA